MFNDQMAVLLPAAVFSLCAGSACFANCVKGCSLAHLLLDIPVTADDSVEVYWILLLLMFVDNWLLLAAILNRAI